MVRGVHEDGGAPPEFPAASLRRESVIGHDAVLLVTRMTRTPVIPPTTKRVRAFINTHARQVAPDNNRCGRTSCRERAAPHESIPDVHKTPTKSTR